MSDPRGRHSTTGRWQLGLFLAILTMITWATLPVALKIALAHIDPWTLTWFRFLVATVVIGLWLGPRSIVVSFKGRSGNVWRLLVIAAVGLIANYVLYVLGLNLTAPAVSQVLIQIAPVLMGLGGLWFFGEKYSSPQWIGFGLLVAGLVVFFHHQLLVVGAGEERLWQGAVLILIAGFNWATYALAQKQLLQEFSSARIMVFIYVIASIALLPAARPLALMNLSLVTWAIVGYCALNTLIAYGAFAEALDHLDASRVSSILALTPLGTVACETITNRLFPASLPPERLDWLSLMGAGLVVLGSLITSAAGRRR